jgi:hypothetical protein
LRGQVEALADLVAMLVRRPALAWPALESWPSMNGKPQPIPNA